MKLFSDEWPYLLPALPRSVLIAYLLWMIWGVLGVHRLYLGKLPTAFLYLVTGGLFGLGWLYDLFTLPGQVEAFRHRQVVLALAGERGFTAGALRGIEQRWGIATGWWDRKARIQGALLAAAAARRGVLTVTEGVMDTGLSFDKVEAALSGMAQSGYVDVGNHPETGVVQYVFHELEGERKA